MGGFGGNRENIFYDCDLTWICARLQNLLMAAANYKVVAYSRLKNLWLMADLVAAVALWLIAL